MANLFNTHPHLDPPAEDLDIIEETREEKVRSRDRNCGFCSNRILHYFSMLVCVSQA